jgi:hypothetical protein
LDLKEKGIFGEPKIIELPNIDDNIQVLKSFQLEKNTQTKLSFEYGERIAKYIQSTVFSRQSYYYLRNTRFTKNELWASGRIDVQQMFQDRLDMNGKINFVNLSWKCIHLVNTIVSRLVGRWMNRTEKISVSAVDTQSQSQKDQEYKNADFALNNKALIDGLQQASGVPVISQDQFVPEDKDELDIWKTEMNRLPEEIGYELGVNDIFAANGFFDVIKERLLNDSARKGFVGTYTWMDNEGVVHPEWVKPENAIYSHSEYDDFRDTTWRGQVKSYKISYLRETYGVQNGGKLTEEDLYNIACTCKEYQVGDKIQWNAQYSWDMYRPYDEWNKDGFDFELRSVDSDVTFTKTTKSESLLVSKDSKELTGDVRVIKRDKYNIYKGVYLFGEGTNKLLEWGLKKNMIRPQDPKELGDAEFSYSFYMYQNRDMRNLAVPEKIEEPVEQMILTRLKIQQLVSKMRPVGAAIDQDALDAVDLGLANATSPTDIRKLYDQTGDLYYRGKDAEGNRIPVPITELQNTGFMGQMEGLIKLYQFHYQVLKDELGEDPNLIQQAIQPRVTADNVQTSLNQADDATGYMYLAFVRVMEETAKKISCLLNDSVTFGAKAYRSILKEDEVKGRNFSTKMKMLPTEPEIAQLNAIMNQAIASTPKLIVYLDPFKILRIAKEDIKLADLYFRRGQLRFIKGEAALQQQGIQAQAEAATQSAQAKAQSDAAITEAETLSKEKQIILTGAFQLLSTGAAISPELAAVLSGVIQNVSLPLMAQNQKIMASIQQQQQEAAQQGEQPQGPPPQAISPQEQQTEMAA